MRAIETMLRRLERLEAAEHGVKLIAPEFGETVEDAKARGARDWPGRKVLVLTWGDGSP